MMQGSLARTLRVLRAERGLTQEQAATLIGVTSETLSDLERGKRRAYAPTLRKIADGYGVPVEELVEEPVAAGKAEAPEAGPAGEDHAGQPTLNDALEAQRREDRRRAEWEKLLDELPGWWRAAAEDAGFARRFEAAKSSPERASRLVAEELEELERCSDRIVELKAHGAPAAEVQSARRDRKQAGARFTAATFLRVDVWRGKDVSGKRAVDYVAEVAGTQRALLAGELFADEAENSDAEAG